MDKQIFGKIIALLFLSFKFLIIPLCIALINIIKLFTMKNMIKNAGKNYYIIYKKENYKNLFILSIVIVIVAFFVFVLNGNWIILTIMLTSTSFVFFEYFSKKKYGNIIGIYENGIIDNNKEFVDWKKIHSYKINDKDLCGYFNDGSLFEYKNLNNIDEIKSLFEKNNVKERNE